MARDFDGATQYGEYTVDVPKNGFPVTLACRFNPDTTAGFLALLTLTDVGGGEFLQLGTDGAQIRSIASTGFTEHQTYAANTFGTGTWHSAIAVFTSSTSRTVYLDADFANAGTGTTSSTPGTMAEVNLGAFLGGFNFFDGRIAEAAVWGEVLETAEIVAYHAGWSPLLIRPRALLAYWPLHGSFSPEVDRRGGRSLTLTGAPAAAEHPMCIYPKRRQFAFASAANNTFTASINVTSSSTVRLIRSASLNIKASPIGVASIIRSLSMTKLATAAHAVTVTLARTTPISIVITATAAMTAAVGAAVVGGVSRIISTAGLGVFTRPKRRWDRRR